MDSRLKEKRFKAQRGDVLHVTTLKTDCMQGRVSWPAQICDGFLSEHMNCPGMSSRTQ